MVIWKFVLELKDNPVVEMPKGARLLSVQIQNGNVTVLAMCDPNKKSETRHFRIVGTGHQFTDYASWYFLGTVQQNGLVWHVFTELL